MHSFRLSSILAISAALAACASAPENVVFLTSTSLGVNVDTTTPNVSFGHDRIEGYFAPRYSGKEAPAVYADFSTNGSLWGRKIKQTFATGLAANLVLGDGKGTPQAAKQKASPTLLQKTALLTKADVEPGLADSTTASSASGGTGAQAGGGTPPTQAAMFFGTNTTTGLKVGFSAASINSFVFGYKRKEMTVIPAGAKADDFPSVLAAVDIDAQASAPGNSGADVKQFFATGTAADSLARDPDVQHGLKSNAQAKLAAYREDERKQNMLVRAIVNCVAQLNDDKLPQVASNVESLALFHADTPVIVAALNGKFPHEARKAYTNKIVQLDASSSYYTGLLRGHAARVCELSN